MGFSDQIRFPKIIITGTPMHKDRFLHNIPVLSFATLHQSLSRGLIAMATSLLDGANLTVSSLGRHLSGEAKEKSRINRADAFVGNGKLSKAKLEVAKSIVKNHYSGQNYICVLVDWSGCCSDKRSMLKASIATHGKGRSLPILCTVHNKAKNITPAAETMFLEQLYEVLSEIKAKVIIITDAGFTSTWFHKLRKYNWDFIGRMRGQIKSQPKNSDSWLTVQEITANANATPRYYGNLACGREYRSARFEAHAYIIKRKLKGRKKWRGRYPEHERKHAETNREPWLIISSLGPNEFRAVDIIKFYGYRMQIEQNFRDVKSDKFGFGFIHSGTTDLHRLENLFLIAIVAIYIAFLIGMCAEKMNIHRTYQANTIKTRRVLSLPFLGIRVWKTGIERINKLLLMNVITNFSLSEATI